VPYYPAPDVKDEDVADLACPLSLQRRVKQLPRPPAPRAAQADAPFLLAARHSTWLASHLDEKTALISAAKVDASVKSLPPGTVSYDLVLLLAGPAPVPNLSELRRLCDVYERAMALLLAVPDAVGFGAIRIAELEMIYGDLQTTIKKCRVGPPPAAASAAAAATLPGANYVEFPCPVGRAAYKRAVDMLDPIVRAPLRDQPLVARHGPTGRRLDFAWAWANYVYARQLAAASRMREAEPIFKEVHSLTRDLITNIKRVDGRTDAGPTHLIYFAHFAAMDLRDAKAGHGARSLPATCDNLACDLPSEMTLVLKACARCHAIAYCSAGCQKADWRDHKLTCRPPSVVAPPVKAAEVECAKATPHPPAQPVVEEPPPGPLKNNPLDGDDQEALATIMAARAAMVD
jgi:hypothetical protein